MKIVEIRVDPDAATCLLPLPDRTLTAYAFIFLTEPPIARFLLEFPLFIDTRVWGVFVGVSVPAPREEDDR